MSAWMYNCKMHILSVLLAHHHTNKSVHYYFGHSSLSSVSPKTSERLDPFQSSSVREKNVLIQLSPFKRTNLNHWNLSALIPNERNRSSFQNTFLGKLKTVKKSCLLFTFTFYGQIVKAHTTKARHSWQ